MYKKLTYEDTFLYFNYYQINIEDIIEVITLNNQKIDNFVNYNLDNILSFRTEFTTYYFKNSKLHNLYDLAIKSTMIGYWYIDGVEYNYDDWLIKTKQIKRKEKICSLQNI